jgi:hypothetical protein
MLSSVLHSERAIQVNIAIMRTFVQLREMIGSGRNNGVILHISEPHPRAAVFPLHLMFDELKCRRGEILRHGRNNGDVTGGAGTRRGSTEPDPESEVVLWHAA